MNKNVRTYHDADGNKIKGIARGDKWNGWEVIHVTENELRKWLDLYEVPFSVNPEGQITAEGIIDDVFTPSDIDGLYSLLGYCITK